MAQQLSARDFVMAFEGEALASIGMAPRSDDPRACGVLFEGDGVRSAGTYFSWSDGCGCIVTQADFRILQNMPHAMTFPEMVAVRHDTAKHPGSNQVMAFAEADGRRATTRLWEGMRCSYVEVKYLEAYFKRRFDNPGFSVRSVAARLLALGDGLAWSPDIARPFEAIERCEHAGAATDLVLSGAADLLMGTLLGREEAPAIDRDERSAIMTVVEYIDRNLDKPLRQEGMLGLAGMSATKFKRLFKQFTGANMSDHVAARRIERAKNLLSQGESVGRAARAVGFETPANFATAFKRATGQTPSQWKRTSRIQTLPPTDATVRRVYESSE